MSLWLEGDLSSLHAEGRAIQNHLPHHSYSSCNNQHSDQMARRFSDSMMTGNVRAAVRLLPNQEYSAGVLCLDSVLDGRCANDVLLDKHPPGCRSYENLSNVGATRT